MADDWAGWGDEEEVVPGHKALKGAQGEYAAPSPDTYAGVEVQWLCQAFRMTPYQIRKKLKDVAPVRFGRAQTPIYNFNEAIDAIRPPVVVQKSVEEILEGLKTDDLPPKLQVPVWTAKLKRQAWEERAGDLWLTQDVVALFGEVFKTIKVQLQLFPDVFARKGNFSEEQRESLTFMLDALQQEIYDKLVELKETRHTPSSLGAHSEARTGADVPRKKGKGK